MLSYILRRILSTLPVMAIVALLVFSLLYIAPGDPAAVIAGDQASPADVERIRQSLGLDEPILVQFWDYMVGVFTRFDLGTSIFQNNEPVAEIIFDRLPATAFLVVGAVILWIAVAIPVGVISAVRRRSLLDRTTMIATLTLVSAPVFWLGLVALYLFANDVGVFPIFPGIGSYSSADDFLERFASMILPWVVLASATAAIYARYVRSQMIDVMSEDYIRTARAKGLSERRVVLKHGLRSALTPIVTLLGLDIGLLLAGNAILTETVFVIPGIGNELYTAINKSDYELIQGIVLFGAFFIVFANLIVDIVYAYLDPRVRYE